MGTIFVAGGYGVGKSSLCEALSVLLNIPAYSAGDLISQVNGEKYGANKVVKNKILNQEILVAEVNERLKEWPTILLAGHFCIFDKMNGVDKLPITVFRRLQIEQILLLEADVERIIDNLSKRDGKMYTHEQITALLNVESIAAKQTALEINCLFHIHKMAFDETDINTCASILTGRNIK
ncbi:ATP-binding protein [Anaerovoracaceae bacterium 42-11]